MIPERHDGMTITSDVERVAEAIFAAWHETPTFKSEWDGISWGTILATRDTNKAAAAIYETAIIEARAAIAAMPGEVDGDMIERGYREAMSWNGVPPISRRGVEDILKAALRSAPPASPSPSREDVLEEAAVAASSSAWTHAGDDAYSQGMDAGARHQVTQCVEAIRKLKSNPRPAPDALRAMYEAMERDKALRKEAERRVREIRGSDDAPGFEACVEAEMEEMRAARKAGG